MTIVLFGLPVAIAHPARLAGRPPRDEGVAAVCGDEPLGDPVKVWLEGSPHVRVGGRAA